MRWLPDRVDGRVRALAWATLVAQTLIVATGGLVRLTASGLGCPTWPRCTADSLVNTPEMGVHGIIEFGNRLLTFVLVLIAIGAFLSVLRFRRARRDLFGLTIAIAAGIPLQAVIGGISVLTQLNPYVVGLHFVVSTVLVTLSTVYLVRVHRVDGPREAAVPPLFRAFGAALAVFVGLTIVVGILVTGSGPHAGDADAPRNGLDTVLLQHVHSWPAYVVLALTIVLTGWAFAAGLVTVRIPLIALLAVELVQIGVGILQANTGVPPFLVGTHMVLACVLASMTTVVLMSTTRPVQRGADPQDRELVSALGQ